jgi:hypothetical protein
MRQDLTTPPMIEMSMEWVKIDMAEITLARCSLAAV